MKNLNSGHVLINLILVIITVIGSVHSQYSVQAGRNPDQEPATPQDSTYQVYLPQVSSQKEISWPMVGANPERTSWTPEQVDGALTPRWYRQFEPYIAPKIQIITAYNTLYISTSAGLYALDAETGEEKWVYATEMPLGHSPAIENGVAYVGGLDRRLHAINAYTGQALWQFEAGSGFTTSPLVVDGVIYIGNRDGYFYAIYAEGQQAGQLDWKYPTGGPIDYSAAYADGTVFFASNDSYAYALNAQTGALVWKSEKLPGAGFDSWWPVVYGDWVIFAGSHNYRDTGDAGFGDHLIHQERDDIYPNRQLDQRGTPVGPVSIEPGDWVANTCAIDASQSTVTDNGATTAITEYLESKPWRRTVFVLNRFSGEEYTTDFDGDGKPEYAPFLWQGTQSGTRYPPVIGSDGVIYIANNYMSDPSIVGGHITGWQIGTPYLSVVVGGWIAVDEPIIYSAGGNRVYWNHCCNRGSGSVDISIPNPIFPPPGVGPGSPGYCSDADPNTGRGITYFSYNLEDILPGYWTRYYPDYEGWSTFGGLNGIYGQHGDQNAPIPYHGKLYMHRSNAVIAFSGDAGDPVELPMVLTESTSDPTIPIPTTEQVSADLAGEVQAMLDAGHLKPGYHNSGIFTGHSTWTCGDNLGDYWQNPADTIITLLRALPYLSSEQQDEVKDYLQSEFAAYPPYEVDHIGWANGAAREAFDLPPEIEAERSNFPPMLGNHDYEGWYYNPLGFYAMWKYALEFGGAKEIFDASQSLLETPPDDEYLIANPHVHNAYLAGYLGYLELEQMAGYPESSDIRTEYDRLLSLRSDTFTKDGPAFDFTQPHGNYCRGFNISRNFLYLIPEIGQYLHDNALGKVQEAVDEYERIAPYWFVSNFDAVFGEGANSSFYDYHALFQAKALILQEPRDELAKFLDVPGVAVGDLFYIDNLIAIIEAETN